MMKDIAYYLAQGLDNRMASYFASGRRTITSVSPNSDLTLTLCFDNGEKRLFDCKPLFEKNTVFEPFIRPENFMRVYLDENHSVSWDIDPNVDSNTVWSNKVDLCPDTCYVDSKPFEKVKSNSEE